MEQSSNQYLRQQLVKHIEGGEAFTPLRELLDEIPFEKVDVIPHELPYSLWQQVYHIRFAQLDILDFSRNAAYQSRNWPEEYWPKSTSPEDIEEWRDVVDRYFQERKEFIDLLLDPSTDLFRTFPYGNGQTLFREALLMVEHTAYHTGEILILMRLLNIHK